MESFIKYFKENNWLKENKEWIKDNNVLFVAIISFLITLGTIMIKFIYFVFLKGKMNYWGIANQYININDVNSFFNYLLYAFIFFYLCFTFYIIFVFFKIIQLTILNTEKVLKKFMEFTLYLLLGIFCSFFINYELVLFLKNLTNYQSPSTFYITLIFLGIEIALCIFIYTINKIYCRFKKSPSIKINNSYKYVICSSIFSFTAILLLVFNIGNSFAKSQKIFEITSDNSYVIMETVEDNYILLKADIDQINKSIIIHKNIKKIISNKDVEVITDSFLIVTVD